MSIEAMKQALEALEELHRTGDTQVFDMCYAPKVIPALRQAIEQTEKQEPVATVVSENKPVTMSWWHEPALPVGTKLYTTPQPQQKFESTCSETLRAQGKPHPRTCKKCGRGPCVGKPQREWVGLTDEEIQFIYADSGYNEIEMFASAIEAKLKEKNT